MSDGVPDCVKKCIAIFKAADSDTEKFAALFVATKLLKAKEHLILLQGCCTTQTKKLLSECIDFKFLKRLLNSPLVYKSVALSILSCFCSDPALATHPEMLANIPVFLDIVKSADDCDLKDNLIVVREAYECLQNIAAHDPGQKALLQVGGFEKICKLYVEQCAQADEPLNMVVTLAQRFGPSAWERNPKAFDQIMNKMAMNFAIDHSERKFELCSMLQTLLLSCRRNVVVATASNALWPMSIYKGLTDILTSKLGKQQRDPALKLAAIMLEILGVEWCLQDKENPKKFLLLLIQLSCVEVRMQLEDRTFKQIMENADLICAVFMIIELSIGYIANDSLHLVQEEKELLYTSLKKSSAVVVAVLGKVSNELTKNTNLYDARDKMFISAMIRVVSVCQEISV